MTDTARLDIPVVIGHKRDGGELAEDELRGFLTQYMEGEVADEQMAALLMAGVLNGFSTDEAVVMTDVMVASGEVVDLSALDGPTVDKHSTGGVGDSTTLVVAPLLAACGAQLAKLSGRGLGHTGGTLDKLEAIPGFRVDLDPVEMAAQVNEIGLAVAAATADVVPLDKRLYALRDVTATVGSAALIAASVMSKKIASGAEHIVLDVKAGGGAFMGEVDEAVALAQLCVSIGRAHGRATGALITDMSQPLSHAVGNSLEVAHAVEVLAGTRTGRFRDLCVELASAGLVLTGVGPDDATTRVTAALEDGLALERFAAMVAAQGGDPAVADDPWTVLAAAPATGTWQPRPGVVTGIDARGLGELAGGLGAGRQRKEDDIDPRVGLEVWIEVGDAVTGDTDAVTVHAATDDDLAWALARLGDLVTIGEAGEPVPLVARRVLGQDAP